MDAWPESPNAATAPPWWAPGFQAISEGVPKKESKMGPFQGPLCAPYPSLAAMFFQKPSKKRPETRWKRGAKGD